MAKLYTGWGNKGKPFTRSQFLKSAIRRSYGKKFTYKQYLKDLNPKNARLKRALKLAMK